MKKLSRQVLSILLAAAMTVTALPLSAAAAETESAAAAVEETAQDKESEAAVPGTAENEIEDQVQEALPAETVEEAEPTEEADPAEPAAEEAASREDREEAGAEEPADQAPAEEAGPETLEETEAAMPAQSFRETITEKVRTSVGSGKKKKTKSVNTQIISVDAQAPAGAFPEGTTMTIKKVGENEKVGGKTCRQAIEGAVGAEVHSILAVDITFTCDGEEIEPARPVSVVFRSDAISAGEGKELSIVHIGDDGNASVVRDAVIDEERQEASFDADAFSVYAIVEEGTSADEARLFVTFKQASGGADVVIPVKKGDLHTDNVEGETVDRFEQVLYDPGVGVLNDSQLFKGWTTEENYTSETKALTIEDVRKEVKELLQAGIKEGDTKTYYPMIFTIKFVSFFDELGSAIRTDSVFFKSGESETYTIDLPYSPYSSESRFIGWAEAEKNNETGKYKEKSGGVSYDNGDTLTLNDSSENVYLIAEVPLGHWLIFVENGGGATYTSPQFIEASGKTEQPDNPKRVGYTFGGWYTGAPSEEGGDPTGEKFTAWGKGLEKTTKLYAKWIPEDQAQYTVIIWLQQTEGDKYDFGQSLHLSGPSNSKVNSVEAINTGNSEIRDDYARIDNTNFYENFTYKGKSYDYRGFHLKEFDTDVTIAPEGTSVVNVYYDRNEYTLTFQSLPEATKTSDGYYYIFENNNLNSRYLYRINNRWYYDRYGYGWTEYTGGVYTSNTYSTVKTITARYGAVIKDNFPIVGTNGVTYNSGERWNPETPNGENWKKVMVLVETMPHSDITFKVNFPSRPLKTMNYYVEALPGETGETAPSTLYKGENNTNAYPGNTKFTLYNSLNARYNGVTVEDFLDLEGFELIGVDSKMDSNGFYVYDDSLSSRKTINIYYSRKKFPITYFDGTFVDGDGHIKEETDRGLLHTSDLIYYGVNLADYSNAYTPQMEGYAFEGWYLDDTCTHRFEFENSTMPIGGIELYAKWHELQYRVFLHPGVPASETSFASDDEDAYGMGGQKTSFRINYKETMNSFEARREEYELVGWYTDEDFTSPFNFDAFIANNTTVTAPYDQTQPTETDDWGNPKGSENKDKTLGRFWITRKADIYAKWRAKLTGAKGIQVEYYAVEETEDGTREGHFADGGDTFKDPVAYYNDNTDSVGQGASTIDDEKLEFKYWVLQTWDAEAGKYVDTDKVVYPGGTFTVLKANAKEETIDGEAEDGYYLAYTVRLRAHYGEVGNPPKTQINWYSNLRTQDGLELESSRFTKIADAGQNDSFASSGWVVERKDMDVNKAYPIESDTTYSYPGCTFLGWAKKADATKDELFLKWVPGEEGQEGHYEAEINGKWTTVTRIAADENLPLEDFYAVWEGAFFIYHSGTEGGNIEKHKVEEITPYTFADTNLLYGGYYLEGGFTMPEDKAAYDGGNWTWTKPETKRTITPKVGDTVYLKEVPTTYLLPYEIDTFHRFTLQLHGLYLLSTTDDRNYQQAGFRIGSSSYQEGALFEGVTIVPGPNSDFEETTLTPRDVSANEAGYVLKAAYLELNGSDYTGFGSAKGLKTAKCYWITPDGVTVTGAGQRALTVKDANGDGLIKVKQTPAEVKYVDAKSKITRAVQ